MIAEKLSVRFFRNLKSAELKLSPKLNILFGPNGSGKTNLAEALYFFAIGKSFRINQDKNTVCFGSPSASLHLDYLDSHRKHGADITLTSEGEKIIEDNGIRTPPSSFVGKYRAVLYNPDMLEIIKDGPAERRKFLDVALCQIDPKYMDHLKRFNFALKERSKVLSNLHTAKQAAGGLIPDAEYKEYTKLISSYNIMLAQYGGYIMMARRDYILALERYFLEFISMVYNGGFEASLSYRPSLYEGHEERLGDSKDEKTWQDVLYASILSSSDRDIAKGGLSFGPARDEIEIKYLNMSAKETASQGQQRILVIALKYAEGMMSKERTGEDPTFILDDIMSELDRNTQLNVTKIFSRFQTIVTTADVGYVDRIKEESGFLTDSCEGDVPKLTITSVACGEIAAYQVKE